MICLYKHMDYIQKLKTNFEYGFKKEPYDNNGYYKFVFAMKKSLDID